MKYRQKLSKVHRNFSLTVLASDALNSMCEVTGMSASVIASGCFEAAWAAVRSQGDRKFPSTITALSLTAPAKSGYYVMGKREGDDEP